MEDQLIQTEKFRKNHVPPRSNNMIFMIYIKKNKIQGRNTVDEVFCLSAQQGYTVFYRNCDDSNVLNDVVVAHPTSIQMLRTWPYVMDTTYKTNKIVPSENICYDPLGPSILIVRRSTLNPPRGEIELHFDILGTGIHSFRTRFPSFGARPRCFE
ncbi:hypothetical protein M9H77_17503 [Catharanthus roseus]|uniref:Uncharacterized protein n=1 Tax=Catharanthus roseus TaxID=4058 RepID=A0ACC0B4S4_CATRO|nr:hypothetical protein M9H77_17503 [Catharanthus roseus]